MEFLLVEDNEADVFLIKMLLEESIYEDKLTVLTDGADAIKFLSGSGPFQRAILPDMMILDLSLPGKSGLEVLAAVRKLENMENLKIIILSSSENEDEKLLARQLGALEYFSKPTRLSEYEEVVRAIFELAHNHLRTSM